MISDHRYYYPRLNVAVLAALSLALTAASIIAGAGIAKIAVLL